MEVPSESFYRSSWDSRTCSLVETISITRFFGFFSRSNLNMSCLHLCFSFFFRELFWTLTACQTFSCFHDLLITFSIHLFLILLSSFPFLFISLTKIAFLLGFLFLKIRLKELSKGNVTEERLFLDFQIIMVFLFHLSFIYSLNLCLH